jgi:hypothetical protein
MSKSINLLFDLRQEDSLCLEERASDKDISEEKLKSIDFFGYLDETDRLYYPLPAADGGWRLSDLSSHQQDAICKILFHPQTEYKQAKAFCNRAFLNFSENVCRYKFWASDTRGNGSNKWIEFEEMEDEATQKLRETLGFGSGNCICHIRSQF